MAIADDPFLVYGNPSHILAPVFSVQCYRYRCRAISIEQCSNHLICRLLSQNGSCASSQTLLFCNRVGLGPMRGSKALQSYVILQFQIFCYSNKVLTIATLSSVVSKFTAVRKIYLIVLLRMQFRLLPVNTGI